MSSFWNRMTGATDDKQAPHPTNAAAPQSAAVPMLGAPKVTFGIAQANALMSNLAIGDSADLTVLSVIRRTLESVGVQVGELIAEAKHHEAELHAQIEQRRSGIAALERQIEAERYAIAGLENELALTTRTRDGLERSDAQGAGPPAKSASPTRSMPSAPPGARPPPIPHGGTGDSDRPTVMAVAKGLPEVVLGDGDVVSILPDQPTPPAKVPKPVDTK